MARPLSTSEHAARGGVNGNHSGRYSLEDPSGEIDIPDADNLRAENVQLRALCAELEQALHEATQQQGAPVDWDDRAREYEALLDEKSEMIRQLHQQLQDAQDAVADAENRANQAPTTSAATRQGPLPREEELLALSEELERERRQLQEDEQTLMEQMRQMEVSMARERAEMARQRNDLQRLSGEIRHELERLERNGALQSKIEGLKTKFQDANNRRGAAPVPASPSSSGTSAASHAPAPPVPPSRKDSLMGRLFGGNK